MLRDANMSWHLFHVMKPLLFTHLQNFGMMGIGGVPHDKDQLDGRST
jgi:hypothetical protein